MKCGLLMDQNTLADLEKTEDMGVDKYLKKMVKRNLLIMKMEKLLKMNVN